MEAELGVLLALEAEHSVDVAILSCVLVLSQQVAILLADLLNSLILIMMQPMLERHDVFLYFLECAREPVHYFDNSLSNWM